MEAARSMLYARKPLSLWAEAVHHANYVLNRTLCKGGATTPFEIYHGFKLDISNLFNFGSIAYYYIPSEQRRKLDSKSKIGIYVGICDTS
jgi:hypothetical protein